MTIDVKLCAILSKHVYDDKSWPAAIPTGSGFEIVSIDKIDGNFESINKNFYTSPSGCQAAFYHNEALNEGVIAYRGTEPEREAAKDFATDLCFLTGQIPQQYNDAIAFYNAIITNTKYQNTTICITGHSLGGGLAQLVCIYALKEKSKAHSGFTFNAPGAHAIARTLGYNPSLNYPIINYSIMNDWCGMFNSHIGTLRLLPPRVIPNTTMGPWTGPHGDILDQEIDLSKSIQKPKGYNESEGLSLWYFDSNNTTRKASNIGDAAIRAVANAIVAKVSKNSLENAISILRNNPDFIQHEFRYETNKKSYILGLPNKENIIIGSKDNEIIYGGNKIDSISGGAGNDTLHGFEGNDTLRGGTGNDTLYAMSGNDTLYGDAGNDELFAETGNNKLYGGSGRDILHDGPGKNYLSGGSGYDIYMTGMYSNHSTIGDSDGYGEINYDGIFLNQATRLPNEDYKWMDAFGNIFEYINSNLIINNNITVQSFKNGDLNITLLKENGTPEPSIPGGNGSGEGGDGNGDGSGDGSGEGSGGGSGSGSDNGPKKGTGEPNYDHDDEGNLIEGENPDEGEGIPPAGGQIGPQKPNGGVGDVPADAGTANTPPVDPLIFDLDFNNIISLSKPENGRNFDIDNDGIAQKVSWINSGDAILVYDRNNNGTIDNGLELFGDNTLLENGEYAKSGIEALKEFDTDNDNKITINDLKFSDLKLLKSDNTTITLEQAGIKEIHLDYQVTNKTDENNNRQIKEAKFITNDNQEHIYGEFMLNQNIYQSISAEIIEESEEVKTLPDISGSGLVHSLHQAIMRDVSQDILNKLKQFINEENIDIKHQLCEELLYKWANTENISTTSRGTLFDGRKLATIEAFAGTYLQGSQKTQVINQNAANILDNGFNSLLGFVYSSLAIQTHMNELFNSITFELNNNNKWKVNLNNTFPIIEKYIRECEDKAWEELGETIENQETNNATEENTEAGNTETPEEPEIVVDYTPVYNIVSDLAYILKYFEYLEATEWFVYMGKLRKEFGNALGYAFLKYLADVIGTEGDDTIKSSAYGSFIYGNEGNDYLNGDAGNDILYGGPGNDQLNGGDGNDIFYLGEGSDKAFGGRGDDTYIFDIPNSDESFYTELNEDWGYDTVILKGVTSDEVMFATDDRSEVYITFKNYPNKKIKLYRQLYENCRFEAITFDDKTMTMTEIINTYFPIERKTDSDDRYTISYYANETHGMKGNDNITGDNRDNIIYGDEGNDTIYGKEGNDTIYGNEGNDYLNGDAGNDILYGGPGNDQLNGGDGNDIFYLGEGSDKAFGGRGDDTYIFDIPNSDESFYTELNEDWGYDTVILKGVTSDEVMFATDDRSEVYITFKNYPNKKIKLYRQLYENCRFEAITFDDKTMTMTEIINTYFPIERKTDSDDRYTIPYYANETHGMKGNDNITGDNRDNIIYGDEGNDTIYGKEGNDTIYGNEGNDYLNGDAGNDILYGGPGNDQLNGGDGNDIFYLGEGSDKAFGGRGDDTYIFDIPNSDESFYTELNEDWGYDTVILKGVTSDEVMFATDDRSEVYITFKNYPNKKIKLYRQLYENCRFEAITFDDKTMTMTEIINTYFPIERKTDSDDRYTIPYYANETHGMKGNDNITGDNRDNIIYGDEGNDTIYGKEGNDTIYGNEGNDYLNGDAGNDILYGGPGNDQLNGGDGNDIFYLGEGSDKAFGGRGDDTYIFDIPNSDESFYTELNEDWGYDTVILKGVTSDEVMFATDDRSEVYITFKNYPNKKIKLYRQLYENCRFEAITFDDKTMTMTEIINTYFPIERKTDSDDRYTISYYANETHGMKGNDNITGDNRDNIIYGDEGNDTIYGKEGNDTIYGNEGNDYLNGDAGNDILYGGPGNDQLNGGDGNDIFYLGEGSDKAFGGRGDDTYIFDIPNSDESFYTELNEDWGYDTVILKGVTSDEVMFATDDRSEVYITFKNYPNKKIKLYRQLYENCRFEAITFDDKTMTMTEIINTYFPIERKTDSDDRYTIPYYANETHGMKGNDNITGDNRDNIIYGDEGNDTIYGKEGNDTIYGNEGNDYLNGDAGNDILYGGPGNDQLNGGDGNDIFYLGEGSDKAFGGRGDDTYIFDIPNSDESFYTELNEDWGYDTVILKGVTSDEVMFATDDRSEVYITFKNYPNKKIKLYRQLYENCRFEAITFDDKTMTMTEIINTYFPIERKTDSDDRYTISYYANETHGMKGNDNITGDNRDNIIYGDEGNDTIYGKEGNDTIYGNEGNDYLNGDAGNDILYGGPGNDQLNGGDGNDIFYLGEGSDKAFGGRGDDTYIFDIPNSDESFYTELNEDWGYDTVILKGVTSDEVMFATDDRSEVYITFKNYPNKKIKLYRQLYENCRFEAITFDDKTMTMTEIINTYFPIERKTDSDDRYTISYYANETHGMKGNDNITGDNRDNIIYGDEGNDTIYGKEGNDTIYGNEGNDYLNGDAGNDILYGGPGNDQLNGGDGNDIFYLGEGSDKAFGGRGDDTYIFDIPNSDESFYTELNEDWGYDTVILKGVTSDEVMFATDDRSEVYITFKNYPNKKIKLYRQLYENCRFEAITFDDKTMTMTEIINTYFPIERKTDSDDRYTIPYYANETHGMKGNDNITGDNRDNIIYGDEGNDTIYGKEGNDTIYGNEGNDYLNGDAGNDILYGGPGNDQLNGGDGNDIFYLGEGSDKAFGGRGDDTYIFDIPNSDESFYTELNEDWGYDTVILKGVTSDEVMFATDDRSEVYITFKNYPNKKIKLYRQLYENCRFEAITFDDKTMTMTEIINTYFPIERKTDSDDRYTIPYYANETHGMKGNDNITGDNRDNIIYGDEGNDTIYGKEGNDTIYGNEGNDYLNGDAGNDILYGGPGNDQLNGGDGNDIFYLGEGSDKAFGGRGDDTYIFDIPNSDESFYTELNEDWGYDTVILKGVTSDEVMFATDDRSEVYITFKNYPNKKIKLYRQLYENCRFEAITFDDKTMTMTEIKEKYSLTSF